MRITLPLKFPLLWWERVRVRGSVDVF